ncbi:hypothetical protein E5676_scaffold106G00680 [Cucumis melo var. makuwa]|uniref:Uncharacterized protein n=1 Tax=Cucumis melo var. makuwa TaxID=1194695 RepID=A0A5D3CJZ1_CUCMM|nr:hypothetical protein E6C27_scaffold76G00960 [Cucumis melo var. makuwa]TYK12131.1 hypothetical protein E5676_scaffold106G00680 [Cucumis melo var. makuwa]
MHHHHLHQEGEKKTLALNRRRRLLSLLHRKPTRISPVDPFHRLSSVVPQPNATTVKFAGRRCRRRLSSRSSRASRMPPVTVADPNNRVKTDPLCIATRPERPAASRPLHTAPAYKLRRVHPQAASTCESRRVHPQAAPLRIRASAFLREPIPSRADVCLQTEPIPAFPAESSNPFDPPSLFSVLCTYFGLKRCNLDLGTSLLGKRIFLLLKLVEQISRYDSSDSTGSSQPDCLSVSSGFATDQYVLGAPSGHQRPDSVSMGAHVARVRERASRGRGKGKGKLAGDQK